MPSAFDEILASRHPCSAHASRDSYVILTGLSFGVISSCLTLKELLRLSVSHRAFYEELKKIVHWKRHFMVLGLTEDHLYTLGTNTDKNYRKLYGKLRTLEKNKEGLKLLTISRKFFLDRSLSAMGSSSAPSLALAPIDDASAIDYRASRELKKSDVESLALEEDHCAVLIEKIEHEHWIRQKQRRKDLRTDVRLADIDTIADELFGKFREDLTSEQEKDSRTDVRVADVDTDTIADGEFREDPTSEHEAVGGEQDESQQPINIFRDDLLAIPNRDYKKSLGAASLIVVLGSGGIAHATTGSLLLGVCCMGAVGVLLLIAFMAYSACKSNHRSRFFGLSPATVHRTGLEQAADTSRYSAAA